VVTGAPTGGTFTFEVTVTGGSGAQETAAIAFDEEAADLQTILEGLTDVSAGEVLVEGDPGDWEISFISTLGETAVTVTLDDNSLSGGTAPDVDIDAAVLTAPVTYAYVGGEPNAFHPQSSEEIQGAGRLNGVLSVAAVDGGAATVDVAVQGSVDGLFWYELLAFTQATDVANEVVAMDPEFVVPPYVRVETDLGGDQTSIEYAVTLLTAS
jgi:hypothetical protein